MAEVNWGSATHPGMIRQQNEDNLVAAHGVWVVADGMGGHEAGEVASQIAVERVLADLEGDDLPEAATVVQSITNANGDIFRAAIANPGQAGMGTTVTAIVVIGDKLAGRGAPNIDVNDDPGEVTPIVPAEPSEALVLANVGDSRTYLMRHNRLRRVTVDHSYVQELVATGHITEDEARTHPRRNIITRALGIEPEVKVDWWTLPLVKGDRFLLCSDGLVDEVPDPEIVSTLIALTDPQEAAERLIEQANEAGGRDNTTVIVLDVLDGDDPPDPTQEIAMVPVWADDVDPTPAGTLEVDADAADTAGELEPPIPGTAVEPPGTKRKRSDRGPRRFIIALVAAAVLVASFAFFAAWARRGYFVEFNDDDVATIYRGRTNGVLWFDPTEENAGPPREILTEESAALIDAKPRFGSQAEAAQFITELDTIPTTTVPAPTTTVEVVPPPSTSTTVATTTPVTTVPATTAAATTLP